jgi:hypothetical protein
MRIFLIILIFIAAVHSLPCTRQRILDCFNTHVDINGDQLITLTELQTFVVYNECALHIPQVAPTSIMSTCDKNGDTVLSVADYDAPNGCMNSEILRSAICGWCDRCD